jgi:hypothetical protein
MRVIGSGTGGKISGRKCIGNCDVLLNEWVVEMTGEAVNIPLKEIAEKLVCPTAYLMDGAFIFENFFDCAAIAQPEELGAP